MATMAMDTVKKNKIAAIVAASFFSQLSFAGEWVFTPNFIVDETYSDNVELTLNDQKSSLVSQTGIELETEYKSQLFQFELKSKSLYALYSHDHALDDDYHTLASNFNLKLGKQGFSLFGSANIDNRSRNGARNSLADIVSADTSRVESYSGGLVYNLSNSDFILNSIISYNLTESEDNIGNQEGYSANVISTNDNNATLLFWDVKGDYQERENNDQSGRIYQGEVKLGLITSWKLNPFLRYYDEDNKGSVNRNQSTESNSYGAGIRWLITPRFQLDISYNKPIGNALDSNGNEQKEYVDASIKWQPSIRTKLAVNFSQRFFGDSYGLSFSHKNKRLTNTINYQEDVQSFTRNNYTPVPLGSFWCPNGDSSNLSNCYITNNNDINFENFELIGLIDFELIEDDVLSLNKVLSWSSELTLSRTTFTLNISASNRENLETRVEDENNLISFVASRIISGRSDLNLKISYTDNRYQKGTDTERQDRYRNISIGYKKSLNSNLSLNFDLGHVNRSSNTQQFNYEEGRLTFKITKEF